MRIGYSEDIHQLVENRPLILAGVHIPFNKGEKAHSDGDVIFHAVAESILGALALGDLGTHFPDNKEETLNMDSALIMKRVYELMSTKGYEINNLDVSLVLEAPKVAPYIKDMRNNIASLLHTDLNNVSIKAGTNEKMGPLGEGKAVKAIAVVLLKEKN